MVEKNRHRFKSQLCHLGKLLNFSDFNKIWKMKPSSVIRIPFLFLKYIFGMKSVCAYKKVEKDTQKSVNII